MAYLSCAFVENGLCFIRDAVVLCSFSMCFKNQAIKIIKDYNGELFDWEEVKRIKQEYRDMFAKGEIPEICQDCSSLQHKEWENNFELNYILINHWERCHLDCVYCHTHADKKFYNSIKPYKILPILKDALKHNMLSFEGNVNISGGEPTALKECGDIVDFFLDNTNVYVMTNTSAFDYLKHFKRGLKLNRTFIKVSIDAGTRETYKKIKGVDRFNQVVKNLKKYTKGLTPEQMQKVCVKYVFVPGINVNKEEVDKWLALIDKLGIVNLQLDIEHNWHNKNKYVPEDVKELVQHVIDYVNKRGCNLAYTESLDAEGYERINNMGFSFDGRSD